MRKRKCHCSERLRDHQLMHGPVWEVPVIQIQIELEVAVS